MHGIFFNPPLIQNAIPQILDEIYRNRVYDSFLMGKKDLTIVDIGANIGLTSYHFSQFAKIVYAIEPSAEHFATLSYMLEFNQLKNIQPIKLAIASKNGTGELVHPDNKSAYSLRADFKNAVFGPTESEMVETVTIEELFNRLKIEHCDFLKIDVEGTEHEILCGLPFKNVATKIDSVFLESHAWADRHPHQLIEALKNNGFKPFMIQAQANLIGGIK